MQIKQIQTVDRYLLDSPKYQVSVRSVHSLVPNGQNLKGLVTCKYISIECMLLDFGEPVAERS